MYLPNRERWEGRQVSAAAFIILRRKRLIRRFREQGATSPDRAIAFVDVGLRRSWVFEQMVARGVLVPVGDERYYLNEQAAGEFLDAQRRRALVVTAILLLVFVIVILLAVRW
jgi:uncharacterized membrane-anchored protein